MYINCRLFYINCSSLHLCNGSKDHDLATSKNRNTTNICLRQKSFKTYYAKVQQRKINNSETSVYFSLNFPEKARNLHEEVLIFDEIGLLSSLGGALGLFIGFSFIGYITSILDAFVDKGVIGIFKR